MRQLGAAVTRDDAVLVNVRGVCHALVGVVGYSMDIEMHQNVTIGDKKQPDMSLLPLGVDFRCHERELPDLSSLCHSRS